MERTWLVWSTAQSSIWQILTNEEAMAKSDAAVRDIDQVVLDL